MGERIRPSFSPEITKEYREITRGNCSVGAGLFVINVQTGQILIGEEVDPKKINGDIVRSPGEQGILSETRVKFERPINNIRRAIIEEAHGKLDPKDATKYSLLLGTNTPSFFSEAIHVNNQPEVLADLAIVMYDNSSDTEKTGFGGELINLRWMRPAEVFVLPNLRDLTKQFIDFYFGMTNADDLIKRYIENYERFPEHRIPLFRKVEQLSLSQRGVIYEDVHK